jgi:4'-phosphopantetheinyl transferase
MTSAPSPPPQAEAWDADSPTGDADRFEAGEVHLWRFRLDAPADRLDALAETLSADERARADRFAFDVHRLRFVAARGRLREVLGRYLGAPPASLRFAYGPHGKPELRDAPGLRFNLSHSGSAALLAVSPDRPVGVDLEEARPLADFESLADRVFSPRERRALDALPPSGRLAAFYLGWTRKEAYLKALGDGLARPLDRFSVSLSPGEPARLLDAFGDPEEPARWSLLDVTPWPGFAACLAAPGPLAAPRRSTLG